MNIAFAASRVFVLLIIAAVVTVVLAAVIYRIVYQRKINRQLHAETLHQRRWLSPWAFSIIVAFVVLIALIGLTTFLAMNDSGAEKVPEEYRNALYEYEAYSPHEMTGYRSHYSIEENPGYTKTIEQQGDMTFTIFIRNDEFDHYHPSFIIYAEYTGDKDILYYGVQGNYYSPADMQMRGKGQAGSEFKDYVCVIGTSTIQSRFELTVYLLDSGLKSENMEDYAAASGSVELVVPVL